MKLKLHDTFSNLLPADPDRNNTRRPVHNACFSYVLPRAPSAPKVMHVSDFHSELGLSSEETKSELFRDVFSGAKVLPDSQPYAMCYGGHQFGHWAGQLGDGRAINLAEIVHRDQRWALQLKGAGETPYSRTADGLAVLRSSIREHLCSEAMHHLGVPTTRSLCLSLSGDEVLRDMMYDGNSAYEPGAIVCRVAPSFIRFGNFQIFASRGDKETLKQLADYTIKYFFQEIDVKSKSRFSELFKAVVQKTLNMILQWQRVGFVHGVMNTDNMSILGLTIDYGPYGWLDVYDPDWTPNTTDRQQRRYRFGHQPAVALWNLNQLANSLYLLEPDAKAFEATLHGFQKDYLIKYEEMMERKLGLQARGTGATSHKVLIAELESKLKLTEMDMTIFFRQLSSVQKIDSPEVALEKIAASFYAPEEVTGDLKNNWMDWFVSYLAKIKSEDLDDEQRRVLMNKVNPKYVLRNYMAQMAIEKAEERDYSLIDELYLLLKNPYDDQPENEKWYAKRPEWARSKVGCSMLSCSS